MKNLFLLALQMDVIHTLLFVIAIMLYLAGYVASGMALGGIVLVSHLAIVSIMYRHIRKGEENEHF